MTSRDEVYRSPLLTIISAVVLTDALAMIAGAMVLVVEVLAAVGLEPVLGVGDGVEDGIGVGDGVVLRIGVGDGVDVVH